MRDESDFIFLDDRKDPYFCRHQGTGEHWIWRWVEATKSFVSLKKIDMEEFDEYRKRALSKEQFEMYIPNQVTP